MLYANMSFHWNEAKHTQPAIAFMTPSSYAGQAAVPANLAIVSAQNGIPTILVDADMQTSTLQQRFGINASAGLSDLLVGKTSVPARELLYPTFVPNLSLLTAGTATPRQLHVHDLATIQRVVDDLRQTVATAGPGLLIIHTPAVLDRPDATLLSESVDQVFLLIVAGKTTRQQAKRAQEQLQHANAPLVGAVMLDV
jgi:capsular exopolysaccharide synthesis family protein